MGSEDLFFKRKQDKESLGRKSKKRQPYEIILAKCEGKTEYYYLHGLREELKLPRENLQITVCKRGTDPMNIVEEALEEYNNDKEYDRVYCVFDKEQSTYQAALNKIKNHRNKNVPIYAITSVPCFDYWLLLHFEATLKPHKQKGRKSSGDQIKSELRKYIKGYREGDKDIFKKIQSNGGDWKEAAKIAKQLDKLQEKNGTDDPSTRVYDLIEYLCSLQKKRGG